MLGTVKALIVSGEWSPREGYHPSADELERRRAVDGNAVWRNPVWKVDTLPTPSIERSDQVLIRTKAVGVCGSDLHMYEKDEDGYVLLNYRMAFPIAVGHEFSGEVVAVGDAVTKVRPGDAVAVEAQSQCGHCRACASGLPNLCENGEDLGFTFHGGTAQLVVASEDQCWSLNGIRDQVGEDAAFDIGAVIEPTSVAYNAMFLISGGFQPGQHVAVFGGGPVGLAAVALARASGAGHVFAVDTQPSRLQMAQELGADVVINALDASPRDIIERMTNGVGVAMAIEATGYATATLPEIEASLALRGKVVFIGMNLGAVPLSSVALQLKGASTWGALGHLGGGFERVIALHEHGRIDMRKMITARYPLDEGIAALERVARRLDCKVVIYPNP